MFVATQIILLLVVSFTRFVYGNPLQRQAGLTPQSPDSFFLSSTIKGQPPQTRTYDFTLTETTGAPDGVQRKMLVINNMFPGPTIEANQGDRIIVNVHNMIVNRTSIHWHGLYQNGTTWFDGTTGMSECGILPGTTFTYDFTFGEFFGTTWWHAHYDTQYTDGVTGALIVHPTAPNPPAIPHYDEEIVLELSDWYHDFSAALLPAFLSPQGIGGAPGNEPVPDTGLINGVGQYHGSGSYFTLTLDPSKTYRLRLINTGSFPATRFSVDSHVLTVIEVDGTFVEPVASAGVLLGVAQRYSMLLTTNQKPGLYWMRSELDQAMYTYDDPSAVTDIRGVIRYSNCPGHSSLPANISDPGPGVPGLGDVVELSLKPTPAVNPPPATKHYPVSFQFETVGAGGSLAFMNNTSWSPLQGTTSLINVHANPMTYAPEGVSIPNGNQLTITEEAIQTLDLQVNNLDNGPHPFHLHGNKFWIMGEGSGTYSGQKLNSKNPLSRDTVIIPASSWIVIRFITDNPGSWAFHCHIAWHMAAGLLMQFNIQPNKIAQLTIPQEVLQNC